MKEIPVRLYACPGCDYSTTRRWLLKDHLMRVHKLGKRNARAVAANSEYWLNQNPRYIWSDFYSEEIEDYES